MLANVKEEVLANEGTLMLRPSREKRSLQGLVVILEVALVTFLVNLLCREQPCV